MDPKPSFNFPLLRKGRAERRSLPSSLMDNLNKTTAVAFHEDKDSGFRDTRVRVELSPRMGMSLNPGYRLEFLLARSQMQRDFKNHGLKRSRQTQLVTDKEFVRKKDEMSRYAEEFFKNQILYAKR